MFGGSARARLVLIGILMAAAIWRAVLIWQMPCISRDGVLYCEFGRALQNNGVAALRNPNFPQHPLFSLAILGVHAGLRFGGVPESPLAWQASGQAVSFASGLVAVVLAGWLTRRLFIAGDLPHADTAGIWAAGLTAVLPLNMWLSSDVMSEPLFLVFFLAALGVVISPSSMGRAALAGVLAGFAFLVRPEGAVAALAGAVTIVAGGKSWASSIQPNLHQLPHRLHRRLARIGVLTLAFLLVVSPYWIAAGKLSPKLDKQTIEEFRPAQVEAPLRFAALLREDVAWYQALPQAVVELFRAGRVTILIAALAGIWWVRRRLLQSPFLPLTTALALHMTLCAILLKRAGYLDPRHVLPSLMCLIPAAAGFMAVFVDAIRKQRGWVLRGDGVLLIVVVLAPLLLYSLRVPNSGDRPVREAADWLIANAPDRLGRLLLGGGSERRISFYAGLRWQGWPENEPARDVRFEKLRGYLMGFPADYLAIRTGPGREVADNDVLLARLRADPLLAGKLRTLHEARGSDGTTIHILAYQPAEKDSPR